jgi:hypothetical protein
MEAICSSETSVNFQRDTWPYRPVQADDTLRNNAVSTSNPTWYKLTFDSGESNTSMPRRLRQGSNPQEAFSAEISVNVYQTIRCHIQEDRVSHSHR